MNSSDHRPVRAILIPWVIAFVALFGLNALAQDHARSKKNESSDEIGLSQLADAPQTPGRIFNPVVFVAPDPADEIGFLNSSGLFLCIETHRDLPLAQSLRGMVQGRAPPGTSLS